MTRHALLIGIDDYDNQPLDTAVNDARAMARLLARHADGTANFATNTITSDDGVVGRETVTDALGQLLSVADEDTDLLFYFSGHGRETALGLELATSEDDGQLSGISMDQIAAAANRRTHKSFTVILDCCFSGGLGHVAPALGSRLGQVQLAESTAMLASSRAEQNSFTGSTYSRFTAALLEGLSGAAADITGRVTAAGLYAIADSAFAEDPNQTPVLKLYAEAAIVLRRCQPAIDIEQLRHLRGIFPDQTDDPFAEATFMCPPESELRLLEHVLVGTPAPSDEIEALRVLVRRGVVRYDLEPTMANTVRVTVTEYGRHLLRLAREGRFGI